MSKTPRILRPHKVTWIHNTGVRNDDLTNKTEEHIIFYVNIDTDYAIKQSKRGVDNADKGVLVIDLQDLIIDGMKSNYFSLQKGDYIIYKEDKMTITKIHEITNMKSGKVELLEVYLND